MKGIIMTAESVRGILDGRKTMTRRVVEPQPHGKLFRDQEICPMAVWRDIATGDWFKPPYKPGDILYVKEMCRISDPHGDFARGDRTAHVTYKAGGDQVIALPTDAWLSPRWRSPMFMPRAAARIFLRVTEVRVERLQEISKADAIAEGCLGVPCDHMGRYACEDCMNTGWIEPPEVEFMELWDSINGTRKGGIFAWERNPWVWVYAFEPISKEEAEREDVA